MGIYPFFKIQKHFIFDNTFEKYISDATLIRQIWF